MGNERIWTSSHSWLAIQSPRLLSLPTAGAWRSTSGWSMRPWSGTSQISESGVGPDGRMPRPPPCRRLLVATSLAARTKSAARSCPSPARLAWRLTKARTRLRVAVGEGEPLRGRGWLGERPIEGRGDLVEIAVDAARPLVVAVDDDGMTPVSLLDDVGGQGRRVVRAQQPPERPESAKARLRSASWRWHSASSAGVRLGPDRLADPTKGAARGAGRRRSRARQG